MNGRCYMGIDIGSSFTKVAVLNAAEEVAGYSVMRSGVDFTDTSEQCMREALARAGMSRDSVAAIVSTGYGRKNVPDADANVTEISCHGRGCYYYFPRAITIIDIGGQDNKVIKLDEQGNRMSFKMNRKCAAGTGAFLEEMSARLGVPIEEFNGLAMKATGTVKLNSFCTVFAGTEVLENIRAGRRIEDIVKGIFYSVIIRVVEMSSLAGDLVATGGVIANNSYLVDMADEIVGKKHYVPEYPQLTGAIGAALYARDLVLGRMKDEENGQGSTGS